MIIPTPFRAAGRVAALGISEILVRSAHAAALNKQDRPMIILGAGEPDFDTPEHIKAAAHRAIDRGDSKYTALDGSPQLKDAVRRKFQRDHGLDFTGEQISCAAGAKQILYNAFMATLEPGDEVIIPAPYWTSYVDIVRIAGGIPVVLPCAAAANFLLQPAQLEAAISPRTRWLLLNSPSNPSGAAYDAPALAALAEVVRKHPQLWVMSDDIYEHILYDGATFVTFLTVAPDLQDRCLIVNGVSKAYAMTGWRLGYGAGPAALISAMAIVQSQSTSCPSSVSQAAAAAALDGPQDIVRKRTARFQERRNLVVAGLNAIPELSCRTPEGAFYAYPSCAGVLGTITSDGRMIETDRDFTDYLLGWDVAVIPGSCFGLSPHFRLSYAASDAELTEALRRMADACTALYRRDTSGREYVPS
jgi:aspartate aminotransferase